MLTASATPKASHPLNLQVPGFIRRYYGGDLRYSATRNFYISIDFIPIRFLQYSP
jgi:hypothetical protein